MRLRPTYRLVIGSSEINASEDISRSTLVRLFVERGLDTPADRLELQLTPAGGVRPQPALDVAVELGFDGQLTPVFSGVVSEVSPSVTALDVMGLSTLDTLLKLRHDETYEERTAGAIVQDLADRAGVNTDRVDDGISFPRYVIDSRNNAAHHIYLLARRCGFVVYVQPTGELVFRDFDRPDETHIFKYGEDILRYRLTTRPDLIGTVEITGESAASAAGTEASSWLTKNFQPGRATGNGGDATLTVSDPAMRTTEAANQRANGLLRYHRQRTSVGTLRALGRPEIQLGDALRIEDAPDDRLNETFQVRAVRHWLSRQVGLITELDFWKMP